VKLETSNFFVRLRDPFDFLGPNYVFGMGEARRCKFDLLIDSEEYYCMYDELPANWLC